MSFIFKCENVTFDDIILEQLALFSDGSLRQALNIVENLNRKRKITENEIHLVLGLSPNEYLLLLIKNIYENDSHNLIKNIKALIEKNYNISNIIVQIQIILYKMSLYKIKINYDKDLSQNSLFINLAKKISSKNIQEFYKIITEGKNLLHSSPNINIAFEMILIKVLIMFNN